MSAAGLWLAASLLVGFGWSLGFRAGERSMWRRRVTRAGSACAAAPVDRFPTGARSWS